MHVLNLVTWPQSRFYQEQVRELERNGVECTTLSVEEKTRRPDGSTAGGEENTSRSVLDYARLYPDVLTQSYGSYDLLHANYGLTAPLGLAQPNLPVVLSLWGSDLLGPYGRLSKACARFADAVIVMSERMAAELGQECEIIPHGVDLEKFEPRPQRAAQAELGWDPDHHHVLFPYPTSRTVKNYPLAERTVRTADARLDGTVELHATSGVPHARMAVYMNAADVLLLTSRREGSPNVVKEALACNLPVVTRDVGDVRERLDGVSPSVVCTNDDELAAAVVDVIEDGTRSNGRDAAREVSIESMGIEIAAVYERVVDGTSSKWTPRKVVSNP